MGRREFLSGMECFSSAVFQFSCVAFSGKSRVEGVCLFFFVFFSSVSKYIHEVARGNGGNAKSSCACYRYGM